MKYLFPLFFGLVCRRERTGRPRQYTFSWPIDGESLKPRGGTTKGVPVTVDTPHPTTGARCRSRASRRSNATAAPSSRWPARTA